MWLITCWPSHLSSIGCHVSRAGIPPLSMGWSEGDCIPSHGSHSEPDKPSHMLCSEPSRASPLTGEQPVSLWASLRRSMAWPPGLPSSVPCLSPSPAVRAPGSFLLLGAPLSVYPRWDLPGTLCRPPLRPFLTPFVFWLKCQFSATFAKHSILTPNPHFISSPPCLVFFVEFTINIYVLYLFVCFSVSPLERILCSAKCCVVIRVSGHILTSLCHLAWVAPFALFLAQLCI